MSLTVLLTNTTWWPTAGRMALALSAEGCRVVALCPSSGHSLPKLRAVMQVFSYSPLRPLASLRSAISNAQPDLIIPCDDLAVRHLHALYGVTSEGAKNGDRQIAQLIEASLGSPDFFGITAERFPMSQTAKGLGLLVPETALVSSPEDLDRFEARQPLPWVLKVDGSWGGHGVRIVRTMQEARQSLKTLLAPLTLLTALKRQLVNRDPYSLLPCLERSRPVVTVQAYISGRPANSALACQNGAVLAKLSVEVIGALSLTGSSSIVRVVDHRPMLDASEKLASKLKLSGFHGFDFMIEERTGDAYLIEMNPRCTPLTPLQMGNGRDPVGTLCAALAGRPYTPRPVTSENTQIAYFPQAWRSNPHGAQLRSSHHDVPWEEPAFVEDLVRLPWPDRSLLAQLSNRLRKMTFDERVALGVTFGDPPHGVTDGIHRRLPAARTSAPDLGSRLRKVMNRWDILPPKVTPK